MNNPAFIKSKNEIIVIDPGENYNIAQEVKKVIKKPLLAIFNHQMGKHLNKIYQEIEELDM